MLSKQDLKQTSNTGIIIPVQADTHPPPLDGCVPPFQHKLKKKREATEKAKLGKRRRVIVHTVDKKQVFKNGASKVEPANDRRSDIGGELNDSIKPSKVKGLVLSHDLGCHNGQGVRQDSSVKGEPGSSVIRGDLSDKCNNNQVIKGDLSDVSNNLGCGINKIAIENFSNLKDIHVNITATPEQTLEWIKRHKLIPSEGLRCPQCEIRGSPRIGILKYHSSLGKDARKGGQRLQCTGAGKSCRKKYSPFTDTIFDGAICRIDIGKVIELLYCWIHKFRVIDAAREVGVTCRTVIDYYNFCREICGYALEDSASQIGGPGQFVLISQSKFIFRKLGKGWSPRPREEGWVFGGQVKNTDKVFMVRVPSIEKSSLVSVIQTYIKPGSIIVTEDWKAYNELDRTKNLLGVCGLRSFVSPKDPKWQIFNNELNWKFARGADQDNAKVEELREGYLQEYLYRKAHKDIVQDFFYHLRIYCRHPIM